MKGTDFISARQFTRAQIEQLFTSADEFAMSAARGESLHWLAGKTLALFFYEPSTRTRASFENAMEKLGGATIEAKTGAFPQSVAETRADAILVRHPDTGAAQIAAEAARAPVINAGDGTNEHPTAALALLYALRAEKKSLDGSRVALVGDLQHSRAAHSLAILLARFKVDVSLVAPAAMSLPYDTSDLMRASGMNVEETNDLPRVLPKADAVILFRVDQKHFADVKQYDKMSNFYSLETIVAQKKSDAWLGGSWNGGDATLAETNQKISASALYVRMGVLSEIL